MGWGAFALVINHIFLQQFAMIVILRKKDLQRRNIFARDLHSRVHKMIVDFYFTESPLCCREMSELHQSILLLWIFDFANKATIIKIDYQIQPLWTKWHAGLPLALKDGLRDLVSEEAIRFNGLHFTRSSLHLLFDQPGSSSHLDSMWFCSHIRKGFEVTN